MTRDATDTRLRLRLMFPGGGMLGPGKADLLDGIARTGSISAAGRDMKMSYKRAWTLVETMNATFREPLVERTRGGTKGGGAQLTELGSEVLERYRRLEEISRREGAAEIAALSALLGDMSDKK
ncbi:winged helix-turn-helix domain-containing protein [Psychromarinibacter sp. S121]|uniref:winged helix-turn-helix domain-containing protein n=1 Tax=Psychromarinibacter sp. S121 TaxID=3415127 RepID=UPI003C7E5365